MTIERNSVQHYNEAVLDARVKQYVTIERSSIKRHNEAVLDA